MKNFIYLSLLGLFLTIGCKKEEPTPTPTPLTLPFENDNIKLALVTAAAPSGIRGLFFMNASTGFAVSYDGNIYKTTNNGVNWNEQYTHPTDNQPLYQILFTDANIGYALGGSTSCDGTGCIPPGGIILKTIDGGNTWIPILQLPDVEFISMATNSLGDLFAVANGTKGSIYKSTDAGINWTIMENVDFHLHKINFTNGLGFCTGSNGNIISSTDNGTTWTLTTTLAANYATDIQFKDGNGFCIAGNQTVYKTTDNGSTWTQTLSHQNGSYALNPLTATSCLVFGKGVYYGGDFGTWSGGLMQTTNAGSTWTETEFKELAPIRYTSFYSATEGYAVAGSKLIKVTVK